jgi:hypothetical protein
MPDAADAIANAQTILAGAAGSRNAITDGEGLPCAKAKARNIANGKYSGHFAPMEVIKRGIVGELLTPAKMVAFSHLFWPVYTALMSVCEAYGLSERVFFVIGTCAVHSLLYAGQNGMQCYCERNGIFAEYKMHRTAAMKPPAELVRRTLKAAAVGQLVLSPLGLYYLYPVMKGFGSPSMADAMPTALVMYKWYFTCNVFNGWLFYFSHRLFHTKTLYALFHKRHHMYKGTIGVAAEHAHPMDTIASQFPAVRYRLSRPCPCHLVNQLHHHSPP